jgi:hypothetical protein
MDSKKLFESFVIVIFSSSPKNTYVCALSSEIEPTTISSATSATHMPALGFELSGLFKRGRYCKDTPNEFVE